jgi:hypothetical protein
MGPAEAHNMKAPRSTQSPNWRECQGEKDHIPLKRHCWPLGPGHAHDMAQSKLLGSFKIFFSKA